MSQNQQPLRLDRQEWERIKAAANAVGPDAVPGRAALHSRLEKSNGRVKTWSNTLAATRQKKLEHKQRAAEEAERARQKVDAEEERIRASLRTKAIDRATRLMYEQQDQIKRMRSKQMLADALQVQSEQQLSRQDVQEREKRREVYFHQKVLEQVQAAADREARETEELARKRAEVTRIQAQQLEYHTKRHIQRLVAEKEEGEEMVLQAKKSIEMERRKAEARKNQLKANNRAMTKANEDLQVVREQERLKLEEEQRKIAKYAADKEKRKAKREAHMRYKHDLKQKSIQNMIDKAVAHLETLKSDEDFRVARDVKLADAAAAKRENDKIERRHAEMEACNHSRQHQLQRKKVLRQEESEADRKMVAQWMEHNDRMRLKELQKKQQKRSLLTKTAKQQLQLAAQAKTRLAAQREEERKSEQKIFAASDKNALEFEQYLQEQVDEYAKAGKNTKALKSALKAAPDLLPAL